MEDGSYLAGLRQAGVGVDGAPHGIGGAAERDGRAPGDGYLAARGKVGRQGNAAVGAGIAHTAGMGQVAAFEGDEFIALDVQPGAVGTVEHHAVPGLRIGEAAVGRYGYRLHLGTVLQSADNAQVVAAHDGGRVLGGIVLAEARVVLVQAEDVHAPHVASLVYEAVGGEHEDGVDNHPEEEADNKQLGKNPQVLPPLVP